MPFSEPTFDRQIAGFIAAHKFRTYLDIGAGAGKYGKIIRELKQKKAYITAVEPDPAYIKKYHLKSIYDKIIKQKIEDYICQDPDFVAEVAIIGDCLEHLKKSDGVDLIHYLIYRTKAIIIVFPFKFIQLSWQGHPLEAHRSVWTRADFKQFDCQYFQDGFMNLVVVTGYLADPEARISVQAKEELVRKLAG